MPARWRWLVYRRDLASPAPTRLNIGVVAMAWRQLRRDLRAGELRLLVVAVTLAVAALSAVGFLADRLNAYRLEAQD